MAKEEFLLGASGHGGRGATTWNSRTRLAHRNGGAGRGFLPAARDRKNGQFPVRRQMAGVEPQQPPITVGSRPSSTQKRSANLVHRHARAILPAASRLWSLPATNLGQAGLGNHATCRGPVGRRSPAACVAISFGPGAAVHVHAWPIIGSPIAGALSRRRRSGCPGPNQASLPVVSMVDTDEIGRIGLRARRRALGDVDRRS